MRNRIFIHLYILCSFMVLYGCKQELATNALQSRVMDSMVEVPEWLKTTVDAALPVDSLNIWIPTGKLETSSLIRVPRFPSLRHENEKEVSPFDIHLIDIADTHLITGVRNEQQSFQIAVASKNKLTGLCVEVQSLSSEKGEVLSAEHVKVRYARYVPVQRARSELIWSPVPEDVYGKEVSGFGAPDVVADPLMDVPAVDVPAYRAQPVWFTIGIPKDITPGTYRGKLIIRTEQYQDVVLDWAVNVLQPILPSPNDYSFFLDLWFNPNAVAVADNLELWSEKHWEHIEPYLDDLASRGAKTVTSIVVPYPWKVDWIGGTKRPQTYMGYPTMVTWIQDSSGRWSFDYSVFDRFVETCFRHGIDRRIDVFSLTPFDHKGNNREIVFRHKESNTLDTLHYKSSDVEYKAIWKTFLRDFEKHLSKRGWLDMTYLSFDESPKKVIASILDIVGDSAPVFLNQFSIAGKAGTETLARSFSLFYTHLPECVTDNDEVALMLSRRRKDPEKTTTYYLCGDPAHPNSFTYSPAIESRMLPWLSAYYGLDGYLRWAYNSWSDIDPYNNPVFNFIQGDDYYVYPGVEGPVSSIRWELLKEGIEDFELLQVVNSQQKKEAIEIAVRNCDGREKPVTDFEDARRLLLNSD